MAVVVPVVAVVAVGAVVVVMIDSIHWHQCCSQQDDSAANRYRTAND